MILIVRSKDDPYTAFILEFQVEHLVGYRQKVKSKQVKKIKIMSLDESGQFVIDEITVLRWRTSEEDYNQMKTDKLYDLLQKEKRQIEIFFMHDGELATHKLHKNMIELEQPDAEEETK